MGDFQSTSRSHANSKSLFLSATIGLTVCFSYLKRLNQMSALLQWHEVDDSTLQLFHKDSHNQNLYAK